MPLLGRARLSCVELLPGKGVAETTWLQETSGKEDRLLFALHSHFQPPLPFYLELWLPSTASHMAFIFLNAAALTIELVAFFPLQDPVLKSHNKM